MHIITQTRLRIFATEHPHADAPQRAWEAIMRSKKYKTPHEIRADFATADFPGNARVVFDIGGNKYRLVTKVLYRAGRVLILHGRKTMATATARRMEPVIRPIRSSSEFDETVSELDHLADLDPKEGTPAYDRMELLSILVEAYEEAHLPPMKPATPQELVQFMAEQKSLNSSDLADLLGGRSRLSEFLNGTRDLSKTQIMRVRDGLGIPADLLLDNRQ